MKKKINLNFLFVLILAFLMLLPVFMPVGALFSYADETNSNVLSDLQKDESFKVENYPANKDDFGLYVISIAESTDKKLILYVYQPAHFEKDLVATHVNISQTLNDSLKYVHYSLKLLSTDGVFDKYVVEGLTVNDDVQRYYDCASIFRAWDSTIDNESGNENVIDYVVFPVAKLFKATTLEGKIYYSETHSEVIEITDKRVGYLVYNEGSKWTHFQQCASHYVAFNANREIDTLYEADLTYKLDKYSRITTTNLLGTKVSETRSPVINEETGTNDYYVTLSSIDTVTTNPGIFGTKYSWNRIQSAADFVATEDLTDSAKTSLSNYSWVLRFCETEVNTNITSDGTTTTDLTWYNNVSEVTILRLMFETEGVVYNLGVVDNVQSLGPNQGSDNIIGGSAGVGCGYWGPSIWQLLLYFLLGIVALYLFLRFLPAILNALPSVIQFVWKVLKLVLKVLYYVIISPYLLVKWIIEKCNK